MHIIAVSLVAATLIASDGPLGEARFDVGVRGGFGVPTGRYLALQLDGSADMPRLDRIAPLWVEAGLHLTRAVVLGAYFQYGFGRVDPRAALTAELCAGAVSCSSSGHTVRVGGELLYRFFSASRLAPWVGLGGGFVSHSFEYVIKIPPSLGVIYAPARFSGTTRGLDLNFQVGADARLNSWFALGPYVSVFSGESASLEAGLRGSFAL